MSKNTYDLLMTDTNSELDRILVKVWEDVHGEALAKNNIPWKTTLDEAKVAINQLLLKARRDELYRTRMKVGELTHAEVLDNVDKIVDGRIAEIEKEIHDN